MRPPDGSFFYLAVLQSILAQSYEERQKRLGVEGKERIEIRATPVDGLVGQKQGGNDDNADEKTNKIEQLYQRDQQDAQKLEGVAKLIAALREVGDRNERHIKDDLRDQPADADGEVAEDEASDDRERVGKHARCVHGRQA